MKKINMIWVFLLLILCSACGSLVVHDDPYYDPNVPTIYYSYPYYYHGPYRGPYYYRPVPLPPKSNVKPHNPPKPPINNSRGKGRHR